MTLPGSLVIVSNLSPVASMIRLSHSIEMQALSLTACGGDDGHRFGLPAPVDAASEINDRLSGAKVEAVELRSGLLDLELRFNTGHVFQVIPTSAGYEAWEACCGNKTFIAVGGGELAVFSEDNHG
jgi:hypothetical protein